MLFIDNNAPSIAAVSTLAPTASTAQVDVTRDRLPRTWLRRADVVICDPPWYAQAAAAFLVAASKLARPGATVLVSVMDELVRPSADEELAQLAALAERLGFTDPRIERHALRYRTPFFEFRAQRAAGLTDVPLDWRVGTLWILRRHGDPIRTAPLTLADPLPFAEVCLGASRVRVVATRLRGPLLASVVEGDVLPTVSSRHPSRQHANVWTSGNSILATGEPGEFAELLHKLAEPGPSGSSRPAPPELTDRMLAVIDAEQDDLRRYHAQFGDTRL
jgi:hypothetical protein